MSDSRSRWWWSLAVVPALVLMGLSTALLNRTGHIPKALGISTSVTFAGSCLLLVIIFSREYDSAAVEEQRSKDVSDIPTS